MNELSTKTYEPVKIVLRMHGVTHSVDGLDWDSDAQELIHQFKCMLVSAGFSPRVAEPEEE